MLVEDHVAFREALASLLTHQSDLQVVAQAGSLAEAREALDGRLDARLDVAVVDPETVGAEHATLVHDLPGDSPRLTADPIGVVRVLVNGRVVVVDGRATGELAGTVLRSGRQTETVATS